MFDKDPSDALPGWKKMHEVATPHEKAFREEEERKVLAENLRNSLHADLRKPHTDEVIRQERGIALQEEGNTESKKQTSLAERSWKLALAAIIVAGVGVLISGIALLFSVLSYFRC